MGFRNPHGHMIPIDHPDHEDHDPAREVIKGGVRTACAGGVGAKVSGQVTHDERAAEAKDSLDASEVCWEHGGVLRCSSGKVEVCACCAASCQRVQLRPCQD
jgi:hypothetical protein